MYQAVYDTLGKISGINGYIVLLAYFISLVLITIMCIVVRHSVRFVIAKIGEQIIKRTKPSWLEICYKNRLFLRISDFSVPIVISAFAYSVPEYHQFIDKVVGIIIILVFVMLLSSLGNTINAIYCQYEISKVRPMTSLIQVVSVAGYIVSAIIAIAVLLGESPKVLLGGIGAMTAVTSIVFKDAILGFVAGIQLISNDMIRIGDWIEAPKSSANGTVIELSMTTVKVENFDRTITSVPAYSLISDAFINWRGMINSGGRRIKRAVFIDAATIRLCDDDMIEKFRSIRLLTAYIDAILEEIAADNPDEVDAQAINSRQLTNIGTFRMYILEYLKANKHINKEMSIMVRQTEPDDRGVPLELYCFTNTTVWSEYEVIQSDIFDHLYSIVSQFGLRIYQRPSGVDFHGIA